MTTTKGTIGQLLRWPDVQKLTGVCRSHAHALAAKGQFPKPIKLTTDGRASAWIGEEIQQWINERIEASRPDSD